MSLLPARAVDAPARGKQAVVGASRRGLEDVVIGTTAISMVDGEKGLLWYRGYPIEDVLRSLSYEAVVHLLLWGELPREYAPEKFRRSLASRRGLSSQEAAAVDAIPPSVDPLDALRIGLSVLADRGFAYPPTDEQGLQLLAAAPTILARFVRRAQGRDPVEPDPDLGHVANFLWMLDGRRAGPDAVRGLESYFNLIADHGMNASTLALRVVLSTNSDLVSAEAAALGALKGPLHGGAPARVLEMLDAIGTTTHAESWVTAALDRGERLMGFGHRVYKVLDPRAELLRGIAERYASPARFELARTVEQVALRELDRRRPSQRLRTNVEFYAAVVLEAAGLPRTLFTPAFALARTAGWAAHAREQASENRLMRPDATYVGPPLRRIPAEPPADPPG